MNPLRQEAVDYLAVRRALGFKLTGHDRLLESFLTFSEQTGDGSISIVGAVAWATSPAGRSPIRSVQRLTVVRGFARQLACFDPTVQVPPVDLLDASYQRRTPYLYRERDIVRLLAAAGNLRPLFRASTVRTFFGLLAATGMRLGEAVRLDRDDVDLDAGLLTITNTKFRKHRTLPLHPSTVTALREYAQAREEFSRRPKAPSFFLSTRKNRLQTAAVHYAFGQLLPALELPAHPGSGQPHIHDLRHTFAVATVREWYRSGAVLDGKLPILSAYLGHADPISTYWYLQACPELLALAADRLTHRTGQGR